MPIRWSVRILVVAITLATASVIAAPIRLAVDATDASRNLLHAHLTIPAPPGPMTLLYPEWMPGEHGPTGPIGDLVGVEMSAAGTPLQWRRNPVDMYAFNVTVPEGATALEVDLDFITPSDRGNYSEGPSTTPVLAVLAWNTVLLYPKGKPTDDIQYEAAVRMPDGWTQSTALDVASQSGSTVRFSPTSLTTLIDSPVLMAKYRRVYDLKTAGISHEIAVIADSVASLEAPADFASRYARLTAEAGALFGGHHYRRYRWLVTLSDHVQHFGLEHHESSDNRMPEKTLLDEPLRRQLAGLLSHEFVHSWNGKYRRPKGLATPDYNTPYDDDLLWVYEGMTQYLGHLLPPRAGLWSPEYYRDRVALIAANIDRQAGRSWRPLADTAVSAPILNNAPKEWWALRRGLDYYDESLLIWLEVDTIIRQQTGGKRSLDDFCKRFHGGGVTAPMVRPYTFDDVVKTLNEVTPYDWAALLHKRIDETSTGAPLGGVESAGWTLSFDDKPNPWISDKEERNEYWDWSFSLGLWLGKDGRVRDVRPGSPAAKAGIAPGTNLIAVNGRKWTRELVDTAIREAKGSTDPIDLLVEGSGFYKTCHVDYHGGPMFPHLARVASKPDVLSAIIAPTVK